MTPVYLKTKKSILKNRLNTLKSKLKSCTICPRKCGVNRLNDEKGYCGIGKDTIAASFQSHFGEEPPLVGSYGSGTIFFSGCNLLCSFCQNFDISHKISGIKVTPKSLAQMMLKLQKSGCHNINFVTPTHIIHDIVEAVIHASDMGLKIPLVYNCGGYESVESLKLLDGIIDIYMPDFKFMETGISEETLKAPDYPKTALLAIKEMQKQRGDLKTIDGIAQSGLIIRHLVMPNDVCNTKLILKKIKEEISENAFVNIMAQYRPLYRACETKLINRAITEKEYQKAVNYWESGCP